MSRAQNFELECNGHIYNIYRFGQGPYNILFFHGVGQSGQSFSRLMEALPDCTFYCPDLPFHGDTRFQNDTWQLTDIIQLYTALSEQLSIKKMGLAGFSIGGKIALKLAETLPPETLSGVYLLAPDGIEINQFYKYATSHFLGKKLFNHFLSNPEKMIKAARLLKRLHILPAETYKTVTHTANNPTKTEHVKKLWPAVAGITPGKKLLASRIRSFHIPVYFIIGKKDRLISGNSLKRFYKNIQHSKSGFYELDIGHNFAQPKALSVLTTCIQSNILSRCPRAISS